MRTMTVAEIVKAVYAISYTSSARFEKITNVQFDSRLCREGSLFVPLRGEQDGHDYVENAYANGAVATFWDKEQDEAPDSMACIFVDDTLQAFQALARYYLESSQIQVVGVTGSNGKTTTKDMIESVLKTQYRVYKTQGNYNNDIGVPKTVLDTPEDTQILVCEMGMDGLGQIDVLSKLVKPIISVITLIGESHLAFLKTRQKIAQAKLEIVNGMDCSGILVIPDNEPLLLANTEQKQLTFGVSEHADLQLQHIQTTAQHTTFFVREIENVLFKLPVIGSYNAYNAGAAILVGQYFNVTPENLQKGLANFRLTKNRTEWVKGINGSTLLNDAYNASPTSMRAILKDFQSLQTLGRKLVVLGDMRELGDTSKEQHEMLLSALDGTKLQGIFLFGKEMDALYQLLKNNETYHVFYEQSSLEVLANQLKNTLQTNDTVLIKSSFGTNLLSLVSKISEK